MSASSFSLDWSKVGVAHPSLSQPLVFDFVELDGVKCIHVAKTDTRWKRLLLSGSNFDAEYKTALTRTDVIEQINTVKGTEFVGKLGNPDAHRWTSKRLKAKVLGLPEIATITTPNVCGVSGVPMRVALNAHNRPLMIELTTANLDYIRNAVLAQLDQGGLKRKHPRETVPEEERVQTPDAKNVSYSYSRKKFCAKFVSGTRTQTYFTTNEDDARSFAATGVKGESGTVVDGCGDEGIETFNDSSESPSHN